MKDTHIEIERFLISQIQKKSNSSKIQLIFSLSDAVIKLSKRAITRANPHLSKVELDLLYAEYHYGKDLAEKIKFYLFKNNYEKK